MIYVVTHTTRSGRIAFAASNRGLARHTAKADAQRTVERNQDRLQNLVLREFENLTEACEWRNEQNAALARIA